MRIKLGVFAIIALLATTGSASASQKHSRAWHERHCHVHHRNVCRHPKPAPKPPVVPPQPPVDDDTPPPIVPPAQPPVTPPVVDPPPVVTPPTDPPPVVDPPVIDPPTPSDNATFVDDFNGPAGTPIDPKWVANNGNYGWGDTNVNRPILLDGQGHAAFTATPSEGSAHSTRGTFSAQYGTFSAWIKMPAVPGYWSGFWTLNGNQTSEVPVGEGDIVETYTQWAGVNQTSHVWGASGELANPIAFLTHQSVDLSAAFHKYSAKYEPGRITYYVDDVETGSVTPSDITWAWGPTISRGNYMILGLAVGGGGQTQTAADATMLVDSVEVTP